MSSVTLDTLKFTKTAELATKKDIALAVAEIKGEMHVLKWMLGTVLAIAIANFAKQYF